ncbi:unnamed protein product [Caretta caretta]
MHGKGEREDGNQSSLGELILLGMSDRPQFELLLFVLILICYTMTLLGNTTIIVVSWLDPHLHTPMYFFLSNLSFLDLCYTTSVGPQMLVNFRSTHKSISWAGCVAQLYISLSLDCTKCLLLAVMAYDCYAASCQLLRYMAIMSRRLVVRLRQLHAADHPDPAAAPVWVEPNQAFPLRVASPAQAGLCRYLCQ